MLGFNLRKEKDIFLSLGEAIADFLWSPLCCLILNATSASSRYANDITLVVANTFTEVAITPEMFRTGLFFNSGEHDFISQAAKIKFAVLP